MNTKLQILSFVRRVWFMAVCFCLLGGVLASCETDADGGAPVPTERTLFMYFPWSGNKYPLTQEFYVNVANMEKAIVRHGLDGQRVVVFFSTSSQEAELYEIVCRKGKCEHKQLKLYTDPPFTTASGITAILNDVKRFAPASAYSMVIGCHGMGWVSVQGDVRTLSDFRYHWDVTDGPLTRFFGGTTPAYQTDITTLAEGIAGAGLHMDYILFDDCYMSNVEVAYDLRHVTDYLIASTCEIMAYGMPYDLVGGYLLGEPDYEAICRGFYDFYSTYGDYPCGTLAVTDCSQLDVLAKVMAEINSRYTFTGKLNTLQSLDGYSPTIFYDYGDYVEKLCPDEGLLEVFRAQLGRTVLHKVHTESYFTSLGYPSVRPIRTFSGLTISDPSLNVTAYPKDMTAWWKATHRSSVH